MDTAPMEQAYATTRGVLANVSPDQMDDPTPCASWTVRELINHMIGGAMWAAGAVQSGTSDSDGSDTPDFTDGDCLASFDEGVANVTEAFGSPEAGDKTLSLPFGEIPAPVFMGFATTDAFVHGWDLAKATGQSTDLDPEYAQGMLDVSRANIQDEFRGPDGQAPFGPEQPAPAGSSAADQLAAFLGRTV